jgi:hypothetical protein
MGPERKALVTAQAGTQTCTPQQQCASNKAHLTYEAGAYTRPLFSST